MEEEEGVTAEGVTVVEVTAGEVAVDMVKQRVDTQKLGPAMNLLESSMLTALATLAVEEEEEEQATQEEKQEEGMVLAEEGVAQEDTQLAMELTPKEEDHFTPMIHGINLN